MATETLGDSSLHVAVDALLVEAAAVLAVLFEPEGIAAVVVQDVVVMTVPAGIAGKVCGRVVRSRIAAGWPGGGGGHPAVPGGFPLGQVDLGRGAVIEGKGEMIRIRGVAAVAVDAADAAPPLGRGTAMTGNVVAGLGTRRPAHPRPRLGTVEAYVDGLVDMER